MLATTRSAILLAALAAACSTAGCSGNDSGDGPNIGRDGGGAGGSNAPGGSSGGGSGGGAGDDGNTGEGDAGNDAGGSAGGGGAGGSGGAGSGADGDGGDDDPAGCAFTGVVEEHAHDSMAAMHVPSPLPARDYNSSPPSSGPHCGQWGEYTVFSEASPLPACNYLHNLEHGAVVVLYNCPDGCPEIVAALEQVIEDAPADPDCGAAKRLILTPYAEMDATVAAAAWGYTWTSDSDCFDGVAAADLLDFIAAHWGSRGDAPEATICSGGAVGP